MQYKTCSLQFYALVIYCEKPNYLLFEMDKQIV